MLGKTEGRRRKGQQRVWCLHGIPDEGFEFEQTQRGREGQGSLECCSPWGHKELDMTYWVNNNKGANKTVTLSWMFPCVVLLFIMSEHHAFKVNCLPFFKYLKKAVFVSILVQSRENQNIVFKRCFHSDFSLWLSNLRQTPSPCFATCMSLAKVFKWLLTCNKHSCNDPIPKELCIIRS